MNALNLSEPYNASDLTNAEVFYFGAAVINSMVATIRLGHSAPGMTLDYMSDSAGIGLFGCVARDFIAWTSGRPELVPGCEERIRSWVSSVAGTDEPIASEQSARRSGMPAAPLSFPESRNCWICNAVKVVVATVDDFPHRMCTRCDVGHDNTGRRAHWLEQAS